jgi:hypothetical protein
MKACITDRVGLFCCGYGKARATIGRKGVALQPWRAADVLTKLNIILRNVTEQHGLGYFRIN